MEVIIKDQVTAVLERLGAMKQNRKPIGEAMGLAIVSLTIRSFNDPSVRASPWAELKKSTLERKIKEGTSTAILKRHVLLARSWRITDLTDDHVRVGSDRSYAFWNQFGTSKGLPARPMLPLEGGPDNARFTPLALSRLVSVAKAALVGLVNPGKKPTTRSA